MAETNFRDRKFCLLLYPDCEAHVAIMEQLETGGYKYAAILHDKDIWQDNESEEHEAGTFKKPHWHVVLKFEQARWVNAVCKELNGLESNYIQKCNSFDSALLYLVHDGLEEKYQYPFDSVFGNLAPALGKLLQSDDEGSRVLEIVRMIDQSPGKVGYREILVKACNNGLYGEFRRLGSGVKWLIDEHNEEIYQAFADNRGVDRSYDEFQEFIKWNERISNSKYKSL